ncbi:protein YgfX [Pseudomonas asuensis]|uniref:protein YgfX n=1 Tax=Pseudomonas asuensis TaxID=1825787 RepID=UPI001E32A6DD|nr:protein YgfX [Pseudomonas asuensis]
MSSRIEPFECHWQHSRHLLCVYCAALLLAVISLLLASIPAWLAVIGALICACHAAWVIPGAILLRKPNEPRRLKHDETGWQLWSPKQGWHPVQLCRDSVALPLIIVLRYRHIKGRRTHAVCIPSDAMTPDAHRRLRVRLKFAQRRWAAPE